MSRKGDEKVNIINKKLEVGLSVMFSVKIVEQQIKERTVTYIAIDQRFIYRMKSLVKK